MKLKGLSNRLYNITFHTHTVSGIVISFALYVIFFAGAFTLFKEEFYQWENPQARQPITEKVDYDELLATVKKNKPSFDLSEDITIRIPSKKEPRVQIYGHEIVPKGKPEKHYDITYFPTTKTFSEEEKTTIGETLYRLHFFDQIPFIGRYLSGFVALFFAFAVITGLMIHWRNIFSKFNGFSVKGSWKQIWTNSYTVFGLIGLPFQFMYAITGAYYMLSLLVLLPVVIVFYNGDQEKALKDIVAERAMDTNENSPLITKNQNITNILDNLRQSRPDVELHYVQIKNYNREDGMMAAAVDNNKTFAGNGSATFTLRDGKMVANYLPGNKTYAVGAAWYNQAALCNLWRIDPESHLFPACFVYRFCNHQWRITLERSTQQENVYRQAKTLSSPRHQNLSGDLLRAFPCRRNPVQCRTIDT